jgi:hypothetical protein
MYAIVDTRSGEEFGPRYGGPRGYDDADEYRRAHDIEHPHAEVIIAPPRLPRRGGRSVEACA